MFEIYYWFDRVISAYCTTQILKNLLSRDFS